MLQAILKKGRVFGEEIPAPNASKGTVLIKVVNSCISTGTEMSGVRSSGINIVNRAMQQPENVKKVLEAIKSDGLKKTYTRVKGKLEGGSALGYSASGLVIDVGKGVDTFRVGERVAIAGVGYANHAEYAEVPVSLVVKIPDELDFQSASTVALGSIAMQGVRRAELTIGEYCAVFGAGIIGLLTIQMLLASGVRVAAFDLDETRLSIAKEFGAEIVLNPLSADIVLDVVNWTGGFGVDCVLFTAATGSNEPLSQSFQMCRKKGRVVLVGVVGMEIKRSDIYQKELDFKISTSYGPGRYDRSYEELGNDYPYAYVRWTENRNMTEYLRLLQSSSVKLDKLIEAVFPISKVADAYEALRRQENRPLIILFDYGEPTAADLKAYATHERKVVVNENLQPSGKALRVALVGAGGFATGMHLPNMAKKGGKFVLYAVVNRSGDKAKAVAEQYGAKYVTTTYEDVLRDKEVELVLITTRHDSHADLVAQALEAGKHVFVEKPLATNKKQLDRIREFYERERDPKPLLFVGFNRRFSVYASEIKKHTDQRINPLFINYRMNAGFIPQDHWVHENGGRIVGEGCHIIDLMTFFTGSRLESVSVQSLSPKNRQYFSADNKSIILKYRDGSICTIAYFSNGSKKFPKEYMEVHYDGKTIVMDDYKSLKGYGVKIKEIKTKGSRKGQFEQLDVLYDALTSGRGNWPIPLWDLFQTTETTFLAIED
jgi:predicted dehydrogenase/Zn-dependent alcohol dehydrogenase